MKRLHEGERGQALLEMVIALPLFLLCLFGLIWAAQDSTLAERAQLGVRYGGLVSINQQPYESYSLYAMYATVDGSPPLSSSNCAVADTTGLTAARHSFFKPSSVATPTCVGAVTVLPVSLGFTNPIILQSDYVELQASAPQANWLINHGIPNMKSSVAASQNFFYSPTVQTLTCMTSVGSLVKANLEGYYDTSATHLAPPSAMAFYPSATSFPVNATCQGFTGQPTPLAAPTAVVSDPVYTYPPNLVTPTPYSGGVATTPAAATTASPGNVSYLRVIAPVAAPLPAPMFVESPIAVSMDRGVR